MPFNWTSEQSLTIDQIHAMFFGILRRNAAECHGMPRDAAECCGVLRNAAECCGVQCRLSPRSVTLFPNNCSTLMLYSENRVFRLRGCGAQPREKKLWSTTRFLGEFCTPDDLPHLVGKRSSRPARSRGHQVKGRIETRDGALKLFFRCAGYR